MINNLAILAINVYQKIFSPQTGILKFLYASPIFSLSGAVEHGCRHSLTCSQYAKVMFKNHPFLKATLLSVKRVCKCHAT